MPRYEQDDMAIGYCQECGREATEESRDFGIGSYEAGDGSYVDENWQLVSPCCEAEVVDDIEMTKPFEHYYGDPHSPVDPNHPNSDGQMSEEEVIAKIEADIAEEDERIRQRRVERAAKAESEKLEADTDKMWDQMQVPRTDIEEARDLSKQRGNSTSELQANYDRLMEIQDPEELMRSALEIVEPLVGSGISEENWVKFQNMVNGAAQKGLIGLQSMLTYYILRGSGMGVDQGGGYRESTEINQIASVITEDAGIFNELAPHQQYLKNLIESCTSFKVIRL